MPQRPEFYARVNVYVVRIQTLIGRDRINDGKISYFRSYGFNSQTHESTEPASFEAVWARMSTETTRATLVKEYRFKVGDPVMVGLIEMYLASANQIAVIPDPVGELILELVAEMYNRQ